MAEGTTLLSYEMGWQLRLFDLMAASQQANDYVMACTYGIALLRILHLNEVPEKEAARTKSQGDELNTWKNYYTDILMGAVGKIAATIDAVRVKYKRDTDIPIYAKQRDKQ